MMSWWHNHNSVQNQILTETCNGEIKLWFWTNCQTQTVVWANWVPAHNPAALCLCVFVCPLIVTLDCSKTATYWDGVGTAVAQAAYVMRHFFPSHFPPPSLSAYTLRKLDGAEMPGITGKRGCVFMLLPGLWMGKDEICTYLYVQLVARSVCLG